MEDSRAPKPRTAASISESIDIEACSITYAATPPISNEPNRGSAASHSAALAAAAATPHGAAPPHSAATSSGTHPEASQFSITAPRNKYPPHMSHENIAAARGITVDGLQQAQGEGGSGRVITLDDLQSAGGSRENRTDSFTSRLASFTSAATPMTVAAALGGHHFHSKSFTTRKR